MYVYVHDVCNIGSAKGRGRSARKRAASLIAQIIHSTGSGKKRREEIRKANNATHLAVLLLTTSS